MKLLAWDTSSKAGALAALEWNTEAAPASKGWAGVRLAAEWTLNVDATHSERLLWAVDELLKSARWKLEDVDCFGVGVGPGSFTGLRIGITTARTLAHALGKPLIGVSSLAALARPAAAWLAAQTGAAARKTLIVASTDACKGELFALWGAAGSVAECAAKAEGDSAGLWKRGVEENVLSPEELVKNVARKLVDARKPGASWVAVGEGRLRYEDAWKKLPAAKRVELPDLFTDQIQGRVLARLCWEAYQAGAARSALLVHPRYLRASDAELKLKRGELPPGPTRGRGIQ